MKLKNRKYQIQEFYKLYARGVQDITYDEETKKITKIENLHPNALSINYIELAIKIISKTGKLTDSDIYSKKGIVGSLYGLQAEYIKVSSELLWLTEKINSSNLMVEDGSIDIDKVEEEGLSPGKILVYRQGANAPYCSSPSVEWDKARLEQLRLFLTDIKTDIWQTIRSLEEWFKYAKGSKRINEE